MTEASSLRLSVCSAFPATGKTYYAQRHPGVLDSDSSSFSWLAPGVRSPEWPENYIDHIRDIVVLGKRVLVSSHAEVRKALADAGVAFSLVYPSPGLLAEYMGRMQDRGSPIQLINVVADNWARWISDCNGQRGCEHIILHRGEYLSDVALWGQRA